MRRILLAAVLFGAASCAEAADLSDLPILRGALTEGLASRPANWQGAYVGVQGGYGTSNMNFSGSTRTVAASLLSGTEMESQQQISSWPIMGKASVHGNGYGGFAGYNAKWDDVVIGFEASYFHGKFGGSQTFSMARSFWPPCVATPARSRRNRLRSSSCTQMLMNVPTSGTGPEGDTPRIRRNCGDQ